MSRPDLSDLAPFVAVARTLSFRAAARELGVSPSAVSHAVGALEARLGVRLFNRTTRSVALTDAGRRLGERLRPALDELADALAEAADRPDRPAGRLRLTLPRSALAHGLSERLADFARLHPEIDLDLVVDERRGDVVAEGFDAGVRIGELVERDMIAVPIGPPLRLAVVAAAAVFDRFGRPTEPRGLEAMPGLLRRFADGSIYRWEFERDGRAFTVLPRPRVVADDGATLRDMAVAGLGVTCLLENQVAGDVAAGRLETVLADWMPVFPGYHLHHPSRRQMRPALRALIDHLRRRG
ncbi:MAG: LysR substrate-binding domain-containing protein [Hyphomicrobiales bacterium]|nr:LysR substrate-binding domain-containing protein [Hyphomicrobiales bacterium]